jgi:cytochrome c553
MGLVVFPEMRSVFRERSSPAAAPFRCQTCHGEDMERAEFKMPHALRPLPAADPMNAATAIDEKTAKFMSERVVPAIRGLLAKDDATEAPLIGCATCHPSAAPDEK